MRLLAVLVISLLLFTSCANVSLVAFEDNKYKFCTNPGNMIASMDDFNKAAAKQCGDKNYKMVAGGMQSSGTATVSQNMGGSYNVTDKKQKCYVYECQ